MTVNFFQNMVAEVLPTEPDHMLENEQVLQLIEQHFGGASLSTNDCHVQELVYDLPDERKLHILRNETTKELYGGYVYPFTGNLTRARCERGWAGANVVAVGTASSKYIGPIGAWIIGSYVAACNTAQSNLNAAIRILKPTLCPNACPNCPRCAARVFTAPSTKVTHKVNRLGPLVIGGTWSVTSSVILDAYCS